MVVVKLYVEGGGDYDPLRKRCRQGFNGFLVNAGFSGRMHRIVACGGRQSAYSRFRNACENGETALLLIDSEDFVTASSPWTHLANRPGDGFVCPQNANDDRCHLMVVCMESWFLADKNALCSFFKQGFNEKALPLNTNVEAISKKDVYSGLEKATSHCITKIPYSKSDHSFQILMSISPGKVRDASPWAKRFLKTLDTIMSSV